MQTHRRYCIFAALYFPHLGGLERYTYHLSKQLIEDGNEVAIVTSNAYGLADYEKVEGISVYRVPCWNLLSGRYPVLKPNKRFWKMNKILAKKKFDMFIINTRFYPHSIYGMLLAKYEHVHCITIDHGTSHIFLENKLLNKFGEICEHILTLIEKCICKEYYGVSLEVTKWLRHFHIQAKGVLYNSVDLRQINQLYDHPVTDYRKLYNIDEDAYIITYTGRLLKEKGIMQLIRAVEYLQKNQKKVCLFIAGDGEMMQEVNKHTGRNIISLGKLEFNEIVALLRQTDIFCLPTMYPEGFPTSTLEAVACRCYPIVTDRGGARELIPDDSYGCVISDNKVATIANVIDNALENEEKRNESIEKVYQKLKDNFTWDIVAGQVEKICERNRC